MGKKTTAEAIEQETTAIEPAQEQAPAKVQRPPTAMGKHGLELRSLEEAYRFATAVAKSGLAPKGLERPEAILIAIEMGAELGLPPMASLQNIAVINGRPSVWGDAVLAVCMNSGVFDHGAFDEHFERDAKTGVVTAAVCTMRRLPNGKPRTWVYSLDDAKRAKLLGKSGPWSEHTPRMMQLRARAFCARDLFADQLRGFHTADRETGQMIDGPGPETTIEQVDAPAPLSTLGALTARLQEQTRSQAAEEPVFELDGKPEPEPTREPGDDPDEEL